MARIDGLLRLVIQQGADELRLAVEREPKMFARGAPKRLSVPATSEETLRILLGDILGPEVEAELERSGSAEARYDATGLGLFRVLFRLAPSGGFEAKLLHAAVHGNGTSSDGDGSTTAQPAGSPSPDQAAQRSSPGRAPPPPAAAAPAVSAAGAPAARGPDHGDQTLPKHTLPLPSVTPAPAATSSAPTLPPAPARMRSVAEPIAPDDLSELARRAAEAGASDLHLAEGEPPRARVDGRLIALSQTPANNLPELLLLDGAAREQLAHSGSTDLAMELSKLGRLRMHVYRTERGIAAALRLLPRAAPRFEELNMPVAFNDLIELPHGLVLVCGAAGAGKSTTLAALAQELLTRRSVVLVTLEDPIEYTLSATAHSLVRRRQVGRDVRDFPTGLRDALRADPEVLLVGEMRDPQSIALALTAAETGHLVLASLHSGSTSAAVERIVDAYPTTNKEQIRAQLADALRAIIVQRLLPRAHGGGRIPAVEVLRVTRAVASLIREGKTAQLPSVLQSSRREGMLALERSLADRVLAGEVPLPAARAAANDPDTLLTYLSSGKSKVS